MRLFEVRPYITGFYPADVALRHPVALGKNVLRIGGLKNLADLLLRHSSVAVYLAACIAAFALCITVVVSPRSKVQMVWVDAKRVVAGMHDNQSVRDRSFVELVRVAVSTDGLFSRQEKDAVAVVIGSPLPEPAGFSLLYAPEENIIWAKNGELMKRSGFGMPVVMRSAKFATNCGAVAFQTENRGEWFVGHEALYASTMEFANVA